MLRPYIVNGVCVGLSAIDWVYVLDDVAFFGGDEGVANFVARVL